MFKLFRIFVLLVVLAGVAWATWSTRQHTTSWQYPLRVAVFPIDADGSPGTQRYIRSLRVETFQPIADFLHQEASRYGLALATPVQMYLGPQIPRVPPPPPFGGSVPRVMLWSLQMRFWAWMHATLDPKPHVRMFVLYHDPQRVARVAHSLGLQKGLIGVVNAFAAEAQAAQNNVVIAHELLHTVGATDKYDPRSNQPSFPDGYAEPDRQPLYPQEYAEIMAGRIAIGESEAEIPSGLPEVLIGTKTAREINWIR
ncbi:MAG TPA: hypothetical protein VMH32_10510 [Burkholderiales bacterium]|nr:hypothetical protein [Burkholderiales bacterium]